AALPGTAPPPLSYTDGGHPSYASTLSTRPTGPRASHPPFPTRRSSDLLAVSSFNNLAGVQDLAGNNVNLTGAPTNPAGTLQIDTIAPTVTAIRSEERRVGKDGNAELDAGHVEHLTRTISEALTVTGPPRLSDNDGGTGSYNSALSNPATGSLVFDYTVVSGQDTGDWAVSSCISLGGVQDLAGNNVNLTGAPTNPAGTLQIDTIAPTVTAI